ncbi:MAG: hypothetical protein NZ821_01685 [Gloeomargarita sp. SKYB31]|nr:hypothetical protein [Gloeomargarita sp. SKYB31]
MVTPPLNVGNILTLALQIYRQRFWPYLWLSLQAHLWLLVPVYGWAKCSGLLGAIARLVVQQLRGITEPPQAAVAIGEKKMWHLFGAGMLYSVTATILLGLLALPMLVLTVPLGEMLTRTQAWANPWMTLGFVLWVLLVAAGGLFLWAWLICHLLLYPLPVVMEDEVTYDRSLTRSWQLIQGSVLRVQLVMVLGILLLMPLQIPVQIVLNVLQTFLLVLASTVGLMAGMVVSMLTGGAEAVVGVVMVAPLALAFVIPPLLAGAVFAPFWQAVLAVIYHDACCCREGWGLVLPAVDA